MLHNGTDNVLNISNFRQIATAQKGQKKAAR